MTADEPKGDRWLDSGISATRKVLWMWALRLLERRPYADKTGGPPRQHGHTVRTVVRADTD
ncbi:hypothetical protein QF037_000313 [Streptomyces canus]|uniref:hypothetical protein n=1 Tax=Streptomyces canus TaxID=58343 RepID=UPI002785795E|nr:hypothetical protein [Streptomyces canus]MDQ0595968.1 hypothetical protein [Streptomyces canus]